MLGSTSGTIYRWMSFGESHGSGIGVVIDGCPSGLELCENDIQPDLDRRRPGQNNFVSERGELDKVQILSGVFEGKTTGAPLALWVQNKDADSRAYQASQELLRPGHASFTYWKKWGHFDPRGGGRASARETLARVCAGAIARKWLERTGIRCYAFIRQIGQVAASELPQKLNHSIIDASVVRCPDEKASSAMQALLAQLKEEGDSIGGVVECWIEGAPAGIGEPSLGRIEAHLAGAMLSLPASKGFSMGNGFDCALKKGSEFNDSFCLHEGGIRPSSNHACGTLAGISTGERILFQVAFKPASSIRKKQETCDKKGQSQTLSWPEGFRHDPCVAIRACPVVEAMSYLVLIDLLLMRVKDRPEFIDSFCR
jgi:chorismate synthase